MRALAPFVAAAVLLFAAGTGDAAPAGLTSWWPGDGNGDDTVSGHDATLDGGAGFATGVLGQGFVFDSVDDLVRADGNADFVPGTNSFSIDAWVKSSDETNGTIIREYECASSCSDAQSSSVWDIRVFNHHAFAFIRDADKGGDQGEGQQIEGTKVVDDGVFHHIAYVRDQAAGHARLYVDGALEVDVPLNAGSSGALSNLDGDDDPVTIGGGWLGGTSSPDSNVSFAGVIDDVQWWNSTALTGDQVAAMCTTVDPGPTSSAGAPAAGTVGQPITVNYTASGGLGGTRVILLVRAPGESGFTEAATDATNSGSFTYTPTTPGAYGFATRAEDASCGREAAPADPDAVTTVAAVTTTTPPPAITPPVTKPPAPTPVPITQIATLPSPHVCVSRRHFRIHLKGVKGFVKAVIKLTGVPARTVKGKALGLPIDLRGLPKGKVVVRITVTTKNGKRLVGKRTYHTCANRRIIKKKRH